MRNVCRVVGCGQPAGVLMIALILALAVALALSAAGGLSLLAMAVRGLRWG